MKVQDVATKRVFHVPDCVGRGLIEKGFAVLANVPKPTPTPNTFWKVMAGVVSGGVLFAPTLNGVCKTCNGKIQIGGESSLRSAKFLHCGIVDEVPNYMAQEFLAALKKYKQWAKSH